MKVGIVGCMGRMGQLLVRNVIAHQETELSGGIDRPDSKDIGKDLGVIVGAPETGVFVSNDASDLFMSSDVIIDFTTPAATVKHAALARDTDTSLVIGTTGLSDEDNQKIRDVADTVCIVKAGNMSIGINLLTFVIEELSRNLNDHYDIEITEMHHRDKIDAPSGTALMLGEAAAKGKGLSLPDLAAFDRSGVSKPRSKREIGFTSLRGGDVIGDHSVIFAGKGERIEITHRASSRLLFATGAIRAALWTQERKPGLYSMKHVLSKD